MLLCMSLNIWLLPEAEAAPELLPEQTIKVRVEEVLVAIVLVSLASLLVVAIVLKIF
jgi:hypothetical protein